MLKILGTALVALLLMPAGDSFAQSQQPPKSNPPFSGVTEGNPPKDGQKSNTSAGDGAASSQPTPIPQALQAAPLDPAAQAREDQEKQKLEIDREAAQAADRTAVATDQLVTGTKGLIDATDRLGNVTWALVAAGAVSAILLIVQLGYLRRSVIDTGVAAKAAARQADAAIAVERPIFVIEGVMVPAGDAQKAIKIGNHGRTPAIITEDCLVFEFKKELARIPHYPTHSVVQVQQDRVVDPKSVYDIGRRSSFAQEDWDRLLRGETVLWAYGYIDYLDFLKEERREGFCIGFRGARISDADKRYTTLPPSSVSWSRVGPRAYTYNQRKD
jgi:hypothetical protein